MSDDKLSAFVSARLAEEIDKAETVLDIPAERAPAGVRESITRSLGHMKDLRSLIEQAEADELDAPRNAELRTRLRLEANVHADHDDFDDMWRLG